MNKEMNLSESTEDDILKNVEMNSLESIEDEIIDQSVEMEISPDLLSVIMSIIPGSPHGKPIRRDTINLAFLEKGIYYGLDEAVIFDALLKGNTKETYTVAKGKRPEEGADAYIEYTKDLETLGSGIPKTQDDGTVNFKELNFVQNVQAGEVLARKILAQVGKPGFNVLGQEIPGILGKDVFLPAGKNTSLNEDGTILTSNINGKLELKDGKLSVSEVLEIKGDVDATTGNINFLGSVIVNGMVQSGYIVKAIGNIEIKGPVEAAIIESSGDIILQRGIQGKEVGRLKAGGNIIAKFIELSTVIAGGNVVTESILHSKVQSGGIVSLTAGKGAILGSEVIAVNGLEAITVGSNLGRGTEIKLGAPAEVLEEYQALKAQITKVNNAIATTTTNIQFLQSRQEKEPGSNQSRINTMIKLKLKLERDLKIRKIKKEKLDEILEDATNGALSVSKTLHAGTKITLGNQSKEIKTPYENARVYRKNGSSEIEIMLL